jgi:molybdate transport system ATP-binding protein
VARLDLPPGTEIRVRLRARDVAIALTRPTDISILNVFPGTITEVGAGDGPYVDLKLDIGVPLWARVTLRSARDLKLETGRNVFALVKAVAIDRHSLGQRRPVLHDEAEPPQRRRPLYFDSRSFDRLAAICWKADCSSATVGALK